MAESEPEDFSKLPLEDKLSHKVWRARLLGYEEAAKHFRRIDDEASSEYSKFTGSVKKYVVDSNQMAQEKGVEAALAFVECASAASKICSDVVAGVVTKCLNGRAKTKEGGILLCLMFMEIEQFETVQEEIQKGFSNKQPKIVAASVLVLNRGLQEFGAKVINIKMLMKAVPPLFEHSDKNVRAEAKSLAIELFRWFGVAIKPTLEKHLKPVQLKELEEEWGKLPGTPPVPPRRLRSEQAAPPPPDPAPGGESAGDEEVAFTAAPPAAALDPYDLADPEEMLGKMPKDFYEKVADPKWKERKEVLETVLPLAQTIKLERGDYSELVKALKKVITKDSNVMVVALAGNIVTGLAKGLRAGFQSYANTIIAGILEKFKEKKLNVVNSLRDAADAVYLTSSLVNFQEELTESLNSKNPSVKSETLLFLCRCFQQCTPAMVPKPFLKALTPLIVQKLDDTTPQVREAGQECLGTLLRVVGDRPMNPFLEGVDKGKMAKIQEHRESVTLKIQTGIIPSPMKGQAAASGKAPAKSKPAAPALDLAEEVPDTKPKKKAPVLSSQKKAPKKKVDEAPAAADDKPAAPKKKTPGKSTGASAKPAGGGAKSAGKAKGKAAVGGIGEPPDQPEPAIANEEVEDKAKDVLPSGLLDRLADTKWKERLEACDQFKQFVEGLAPGEMQSLLFLKVLARKPGWKDSNFQVMNAKFDVASTLVQKASVFGKKSTACLLPALVDKFADIKVKVKSGETLMVLSERMTLNYVSLAVMKAAFEQKSPKVQSESLDWLGNALKAFGFLIKAKPHIDYIKKGFAASNPAIRTAAINLVGVLHLFLGAQCRVFFEEEKPALLSQIDDAIAKVSGETAPVPTRGPNVPGEDEEDEDEDQEGATGEEAPSKPVSLADMMDKVDISPQIKPDLIKELADKNWKVRNESLQKVQEILKTAKFVKPSLGELPGALKGRLGDSNKKLIITTLDIIKTLAGAMGSSCSKFLKTFIPGTLSSLGDSNPGVRGAALETLNAWHTELSLGPFIEQELVATALATESANLRSELLGWFQEKLSESRKPSSEISAVISPLYSCLEDRSGEVRKKANSTLPVLISKIGYEIMVKEAGKLKGSSKGNVMGMLEKHKGSAPAAKAPAAKTPAAKAPPEPSKPETVEKKEKPEKSSAKKSGAKSVEKKTAKAGSGKKGGAAEPSSGPPLVFVPNGKESRIRDEEKMKTIKWNFESPRGEHIEQLKDQLSPCTSADLHAQLFHDDFKKHIAALATLTKFVSAGEGGREAAVGAVDVLLRWVTLRFFDTNTTVNLKCLEFLAALFKMLITMDGYRLSDYEATSFLPYLVNKVGDSKDPVRKGVRALFRDICSCYPPAKLFSFVLDGLKSKNARQRTECLEELGLLIKYNGMLVCGPQPQKTVPNIAHQISDRDNSVRSAALNTMVIVNANAGDGFSKFISQLSAKDASLLEERIRRSGVKAQSSAPPPAKEPPPPSEPPAGTKQLKLKPKNVQAAKSRSSSPAEPQCKENTPPAPEPPAKTEPVPVKTEPPKPTGPFKYVPLGSLTSLREKSIFTPLSNADSATFRAPPLKNEIELKSRKIPHHSYTMTPTRQAKTSEAISYIISQITSNDPQTAAKGIKQIEAVIVSPSQRPALTPHIDQLLRAVLLGLRVNFSSPLTNANEPDAQAQVMEVAKTLTSCIVKVLEQPSLASLVTQDTLMELERDIISYLPDERLLKLGEAPMLVRVFNYLMLKLCDNCDKNNVFGSLLQLLAKAITSEAGQTRQTELVMKCIWRLTRQLSQFIASLQLDRLLLNIHLCFEAYSKHPSPDSDVPVRTVKTILFHVVNSVGEDLLNHLSLIKDSKHSQVTLYINKTIKKTATSKVTFSESVNRAQPVVSKEIITSFSEALKKIGYPATREQGLRELCQIKTSHPEFDIQGYLEKVKVSRFYRSYIERALQEGVVGERDTGDYDQAFDKVRTSASEIMGLTIPSGVQQPQDLSTTPSVIPPTKITELTRPSSRDPVETSGGKAKDRSTYLEEMRKKLDRLKGTT